MDVVGGRAVSPVLLWLEYFFLLLLQPFFESDLCTYEPHEIESKSYSTRLLYIEEQKQQKISSTMKNSSCAATENRK